KVVTFSGAIERGLVRPDTPVAVPGSIRVADRVIHDAWSHGLVHYSAVGVLAKSSNVGTLEIAQRLGPRAWYDYITTFGIGTRTVRSMLEAVTQKGGTAPTAAIDGYRTAGKTGTAQKPNPQCHCYSGGGYWATFAGIAPADNPQFVVAVVIDDAKGGRHGGAVAAPLFKQIASYALTQRGVPPSGS